MTKLDKLYPPIGFIERCYKDKQGRVTVWQAPNTPIMLWAICRIALLLMTNNGSTLYSLIDVVAFGSLFTWAWLELFSGTNYIRRFMGIAVLFVAIAGRV